MTGGAASSASASAAEAAASGRQLARAGSASNGGRRAHGLPEQVQGNVKGAGGGGFCQHQRIKHMQEVRRGVTREGYF